jgi:hypothetical protein
MKTFQLKLAAIALLLIVSIDPLHSQTAATSPESLAAREKIIAVGLRGYETSLRITNSETTVESAIFQSVKMKLREPDRNYSKIIGELKSLSFNGSNPALRYKAYVAASIMPNPAQFLRSDQIEHLKTFTEETRNEFFAAIAEALQEQRAD